jgi:hypothetical protein
MTNRIRRTAQQIANDLDARAQIAKNKVKNMEEAKRTRTAIIAGKSIRAMAAAGDPDASRAWDKMLTGLKRKQDRLAFGLEPLPDAVPDDQQPVNPPAPPAASDPLEAATARLQQALKSWEGEKLERNRVELGEAIAAREKLTGVLWENVPPAQRVGWGLSDRPGVLLDAPRPL